jgi:hypothetical protein
MGFVRAPEEDGVLNFVNSFLGSQLSIRYRKVRSGPPHVVHDARAAQAWGLVVTRSTPCSIPDTQLHYW